MAAIAERKEDFGSRQGRLCLRKLNSDEQIAATAVAGAAIFYTFRYVISAYVRQTTIIKRR